MEETDVEEKEVEKVDVVLVEEENKEEDAATKECENKESCTTLERHGKGEDVPMMGQNEANHVGAKKLGKRAEDAVMEDVEIPEEDGDNNSDELFDDDSDGEQSSASEEDDGSNTEVSLTDSEIEELVTEFLEVESKAAEAQEALEKESLAQVESDVRAELAENLHGDELEAAVSTEMETYIEEWETMLDNLETQSSLLLEQLDGAGIELPSLYKWIESQAPNGCCTEAWKKRAHWVGCQATNELNQSVRDAEEHLQSCRPVRRQHGRLLEEGASGFLSRKLSIEENVSKPTENSEKDWTSFNELIQSNCANNISYGGANWASVYLASTPLQAANMGFKFPGVDEVEEIGEIDATSSDPFYADAIANEKEIDLSEEQKKNFRKVREEDDAKITRKLQHNLKQRRQRNKSYSESIDKDALCGSMLLNDSCQPVSGELNSLQNGLANGNTQNLETDMVFSNNTEKEDPTGNGSCKRAHDNKDEDIENKRQRTVIIDSDDEVLVMEGKSVLTSCKPKSDKEIPSEAKETVDIIDVDILPSPGPKDPHLHTTDDSRNFRCTACFEILKAPEVQRHPLLEVIVCRSCKSFVDDKIKDPVSSGDYCVWCGNCKELITCNSCNKLFCTICISRNLGEECLSECKAGWRCCCCLPVLLRQLISECDKALGDMLDSSSESDSDLSDAKIDVAISNKRRRKKRIRRILDDTELGEETKRKIAMEKERQEHLKSMQVQSAGRSIAKCVAHANGHMAEGAGIGMLGDATDGYIVNVAREQDEEPVRLPPSISAKLKLHQVEGIRFMWENIVQSVRKVKSGDKGLGCILAHTMGLGKTFQVIAFLYAAMRCVDLGLKTALIVTPVNVLHNWRQEFVKWRPVEVKPLRVLMLEDVSRERRSDLLARWRVKGGVLLIGYAAFRNLSLGRHVKDRNAATEMCHALQHGPDFLVCDEAHMIKNTKADITQALKQVKTQRRIALTGSPLQNNLMEYYCMVDFVREGFLGSSHEFRNRFQNPIENGQHANSTSYDVKIMNQRSHILYEQLKGFVQRMDMNVVKKDLPPKTVFVITVKLSPLQRKLYKKFLDVHGFTSDKISSDRTIRRSCFFAGYQALAQIWNHPGLLQMVKEHRDNLRREDSVENFMMDDGSSDDNLENNDLLSGEKQRTKNDLILKRSDGIFNNEESNWWEDLVVEKIYKEVDYSGKMVLLLDILSMSADVGDKALVFSQSLPTLDLIELFLSKLPQKGREGKYWRQGKDWYRLDGSTEGCERQKIVERFNEPTNKRVKCTLISTRAGSLGINLHAANRVIIVDGSWNPTYDLQAIYRVWRYGQRKPVYAYRLMAHGTMEEKIYKRQVTKEGLAARVVDRQQIHRTMSKEEVLHLFDFGYDESIDVPEESQEVPIPSTQNNAGENTLSYRKNLPLSYGATSSDKFMESLISKHYPRWIANYHEHESLLQENEAERLSKEEQDMAWQIYQQSFGWEEVNRISIDDVLPSERKPEGNFHPSKRNLEGDFDSSERKPEGNNAPSNRKPERNSALPESNAPQHSKASSRSRSSNQRKCTNLSHLLTLRSQGIKPGSTTVCGECLQEIGWENLNRDGKSR